MTLRQWKLFYQKNVFTGTGKEFVKTIVCKVIYAHNENDALVLGEAIAANDGKKLLLPIDYDFIEITEYFPKVVNA